MYKKNKWFVVWISIMYSVISVLKTYTWRKAIISSINIIMNSIAIPKKLIKKLKPLEAIAAKIKEVSIFRRACPAIIFAKSLILRLKILEK